jgi:hypothetical protein
MLNKKQSIGSKSFYLFFTAGAWVISFGDNLRHKDVYHQEVIIL